MMDSILLGLVELLAGLCIGYLAATISESTLHRVFGHASARARRRCQSIPVLRKLIVKLHYGHAVVHHAKTFRENHVTQFRSPQEQQHLDEDLARRGYDIYIQSQYGLVTDKLGVLYFAGPPIIVVLLACIVLLGSFSPLFLIAASLPIAGAPLLSCCVHPYLHLRLDEVLATAPPITAFIVSTRYGRWVRISHFVHHRHPRYNFNLLPGGDYLLGCHRAATVTELQEMLDIGLLE